MRTIGLDAVPVTGFVDAQSVAAEEAGRYLKDPMILSWLDRKEGRHFPDVECCGDGDKESWEIYAESRGGEVRVEVGGSYVFIFREGLASS